MATTVVINGVTYDNVPIVRVPRPSGNYRAFRDCSDANAAVTDVASGKVFYNGSGRQVGTGSVGSDSLQQIMNGHALQSGFLMEDMGGHDCQGLTLLNAITLPATVTSVINYAFSGLIFLTTFSATGAVTVGDSVFQGCSGLTTVSLPACTSAGSYCFANCGNLTSLIFPALTEIPYAFLQGCYSLEDLYLGNNSVVTFEAIQADNPFSTGGITLNVHVPANLLASYQSDSDWLAVIQKCSNEGITLTLVGDYA